MPEEPAPDAEPQIVREQTLEIHQVQYDNGQILTEMPGVVDPMAALCVIHDAQTLLLGKVMEIRNEEAKAKEEPLIVVPNGIIGPS